MSFLGERNAIALGVSQHLAMGGPNLLNKLSPSLLLQFAGAQTLDPRITFSRTSNATLTNSDGLIAYAPHNLLTYSEQFDNAAWVRSGGETVAANSQVSPVGQVTSDKVQVGTSTFAQCTTAGALAPSSQQTFSVYLKAGEIGFAQLRIRNSSAQGNYVRTIVNLATGALSSTANFGNGAGAAATATQEENGYWRVSVSGVPDTSGSSVTCLIILMKNESAVAASSNSAAADGIYAWGAQLNVGALQPYYTTTVKNLLGYTQAFDNAAWTKSNAFVQTNLLTYSEQFDNVAWVKGGATVTANTAVAPDGTQTADTATDSLDATATVHALQQSVTWSSGLTYTISVYAKQGTLPGILMLFPSAAFGSNLTARFNVATGVVASTDAGVVASITSVGNGWYRCTATATATASSTTNFQIRTATSTGSFYQGTGDGTVFLWGAQLVQGSTPGDYQRTEAAAKAVMYPAPDGSLTADKLVENTSNTQHYTNASSVSTVAGSTYTLSCYAKSAERSVLNLEAPLSAGQGVTGGYNLATGAVIAVQTYGYNGAPNPTATVVNVGGGWYRCSLTFVVNGSSISQCRVKINNNTISPFAQYTGDGTSGVYIWGAQLSDSASLDQYVYNPVAAPAAAAYYGPRFDYDPVTLAPKGLLIEESRTNLLLQSGWAGAVAGTPGTAPTSWSFNVAGGSITAVIPNTINQNYIEFSATVNRHFLFQSVAVSANTTYVFSAYVGANSGIPLSECIGVVGLPTGATSSYILNGVTDSGSSIPTAGSRIGVVIVVSTTAGSGVFRIGIGVQGSRTGSVSLGQPQLEAGAFPTSYIPTTTAAATRAADVAVMQGANFSNWYNQSEGTIYLEADMYETQYGFFRYPLSINDASSSTTNIVGFTVPSNSSNLRFIVASAGVSSASLQQSLTLGSAYKVAGAYKLDDFAVSLNAGTPLTDTSGNVASGVNTLVFGNTSHTLGVGNHSSTHYKRLAFFPRRLEDAELQAITN